MDVYSMSGGALKITLFHSMSLLGAPAPHNISRRISHELHGKAPIVDLILCHMTAKTRLLTLTLFVVR